MSRFMDLTTDFGFKKLFGDEANIDVTMNLLNTVLELQSPVVALSFANPEQLPESGDQRIGVYDLLCRDAAGNRFLVEMQKSRLAFIKDRMVYYTTFPIAAQAPKGLKRYQYSSTPAADLVLHETAETTYDDEEEEDEEVIATAWDYELKAVYCVAILGYALNGSTTAVNSNSLRNDRPPHALFYDKLKFVTVELSLFDPRLPEYSLDRRLNKWLYFLKHSADFERIPDVYKNDKIFQKAFWIAELANFTPQERQQYHISVKRTRDTYAALKTSHDLGKVEGMIEGKVEGMIEGKNEGKVEGKIEGKIEGRIEDLLLLFTQKLGPVPDEIDAAIRSVNDLDRLRHIMAHFMKINDWEALRKYLVS